MGLNEFLMWLGGTAGASAVASWLLERIPAYVAIASAEVKRWVFFAVCLVLALTSYGVLTYVPAEALRSVAPVFGLIASTFLAVFTGSGFHKVDKL